MDNKYKNITAMFMSILMLSSALLLFVPPEVNAQGPTPEFTLEVTGNNPVQLDVSPRGTGIGTTVVTVTSQSIHTLTIQVNINVAGYQVSPLVSTVTLAAGASTTINVAVAALMRSPYKVGQGMVHGEVTRVDGVGVSPGTYADAGFMVTSKPYGKVILSSDKPFQKVKPGKEYPFKIKVMNNGNAVDGFDLEITNKDKLEDKGFSIICPPQTGDMEPHAREHITIQVQTPRKFWRNEYYTINIKATSDVDTSEISEYSVTVWVWGVYVPGFEIAFTIIALALVGTFMARRRQD